MPLFADFDTNSVILIIGAVFLGLQQMYKMYLDSQKAAEQKAATAEVKQTLIESDAKKMAHLERQDTALGVIAAKVDTVQKQTNGITEKLEEASFKAGVQSEVDRANDQIQTEKLGSNHG